MYGIRKNIIEYVRKDYSENLPDFEYTLDCSLGTNPWGLLPSLTWSDGMLDEVSEYPHTEVDLKYKIVQKFKQVSKLTEDMISFSSGSIGVLMTLNRLFLEPGKNIIGVAPQFSAALDDFNIYEAIYNPVYLRKEEAYGFNEERFIKKVAEANNAYIYIDNPNNPTGQIISLESIEKIVNKAREKNSFVVIDEAYGDYMDIEESAIALVNKYDNLAVIRTFSKGLGAAGIRLGYVIGDEKILKEYNKINIPFSMSHIAGKVAEELIGSNWENKCRPYVNEGKEMLLKTISKLKNGETSVNVPITLLYTEDENVDLEEVMEKAGLKVISCVGYEGLGKNAVRINLNKDLNKMMELIKKTEEYI